MQIPLTFRGNYWLQIKFFGTLQLSRQNDKPENRRTYATKESNPHQRLNSSVIQVSCATIPHLLSPCAECGIFVELRTHVNLNDCKKGAWGQFITTSTLVIFSYWRELSCQRIGVYRTSVFSSIKLNIDCPNSICNIFSDKTFAYNRRQSDFSTPRYNTVTYGRHSLLYLGPKLWGKLLTADRSAVILKAFINRAQKWHNQLNGHRLQGLHPLLDMIIYI